MPASDDTIEFTVWMVYVGKSLHDTDEPPVEIVLDSETLYGLERSIPMFWQVILTAIHLDLRRRAG